MSVMSSVGLCSRQWCSLKQLNVVSACVCVCVLCVTILCAGLKSATSGLQEEKEKYERELIPLSQSVNEAKSKVSNSSTILFH